MSARRWWWLSPVGCTVGIVAAILSLTPSLVPRPAMLQGALAGVSFAIGYAVGVALVAATIGVLAAIAPSKQISGRSWPVWLRWAVVAVLAAALVLVGVLAVGWQNEVRSLVEVAPLDGIGVLALVAGFLVTAALLLLVGRGLSRLRRQLQARMSKTRAPGLFSWLTTAAIFAGAVFVLVSVGMFAVDRIWWGMNGTPGDGVSRPTDALRSGSQASEVAWESLGRHGASFVSGGPTAADIREATGAAALTPIRVYVGVASAATLDDRVAMAVRELERTGAFDRSILAVVLPTGSGWLEAQTVDSLEYVAGGDTAIVGVQYAYTPSWASSLFAPELADQTAKALFAAVEQRWLQLPKHDRPRLLVHGLSLGAQGTQNSFADLADMRARTDGALLVGSPGTVAMWRELQDSRDAGTPAWQPVLDGGAQVRWASLPGDFDRPSGAWQKPRVGYLQHATDPVTWLAPELFWAKPDWLRADQRGPDVSTNMVWIPAITGLQVTVDMLVGTAVPARHGHNYGDVMVDAWMGVLQDTDLSPNAVANIQERIAKLAPILPFEE